MCSTSDDACGFCKQVTGKDQHNRSDNAQHTHFSPFRLALAGFVKFGEAKVSNPKKAQYRNCQPQYETAIFDIALN